MVVLFFDMSLVLSLNANQYHLEYKYMDILLTSSVSWSSAHSKLVSQAQKALFAIYTYQVPIGYFSVVDSFKMFDTMVKSILSYASQIWGYEYVNTIESVHNKFCINILYVRRTTNTCMVLGDCGRLPLCTTYSINCARYWCNLLTMPSHRHPKQRSLLYKYGLSFVWISQNVDDVSAFTRMFKQKVVNFCTLDKQAAIETSSGCYHYKYL